MAWLGFFFLFFDEKQIIFFYDTEFKNNDQKRKSLRHPPLNRKGQPQYLQKRGYNFIVNFF